MFLSIIKRTVIYIIGLFILSAGVAFSAHCGIGVSPVGTVPMALMLSFKLELGLCSTLAMIFYILLQMIILGRKYKPINILQIFAAVMFGTFIFVTERGLKLVCSYLSAPMEPTSYFTQLLYLAISIICVGTGVFLYLKGRMVNLPADGVFVAFHQRFNVSIAKSKISFDFFSVSLATIIAIYFIGQAGFIREGTILSCFLVGPIIGFWNKVLGHRIENFITPKKLKDHNQKKVDLSQNINELELAPTDATV